MPKTNEDRLRGGMDELATLKDQIRVDLHLAKMDLRDEWKDIERRLPDPSTVAADVKTYSAQLIEDLAGDLRRFRDKLRKVGGPPQL